MSIDWGSVAKDHAAAAAPAAGIDWGKVKSTTPAPVAGPQPPVDFRALQRTAAKGPTALGGVITYGHDHPFESVMNVLGTPQRALQAAETGSDLGRAITHPGDEPRLAAAVKEKIGLGGLERGALAGNDLGHKVARGTADFAVDLVNDPMTFLPVGKLAKLAGIAIPELKAGKIGKILNSEAPLEGLTDKGKATFEAIMNRAHEYGAELKRAEDAVVKKNAAAIRAGKMPDEVAALFRSPKNVPEVTKGTRPQDVVTALVHDRQPAVAAMQNKGLREAGLVKAGREPAKKYAAIPGVKMKENPGGFFEDPSKIAEVQAAIGKAANPRGGDKNLILQGLRSATRLGNKAFLASPFPHGVNLANLSFNEYGLPNTLKGIGNAARVATGTVGEGHLADNIAELEKLGAKSQYHHIFDEMGITKVAGIPGTEPLAKAFNTQAIPAQRFSNFLQDKFLNPLETGLRSSALDAERKGGTTGVEAARKIHTTFGSNKPNALTQSVSDIGQPFAKFHLETAPRSGLATLAKNPGRFTAPLKADRDENAQVNPGGSAKFHLNSPTFATARAVADPLHYFASMAGPLGQMGNSYSMLSQLQKGKVGTAAGDVAARFTPGSEASSALARLIAGKKGPAGEDAIGDLISSVFTGGYYSKAMP